MSLKRSDHAVLHDELGTIPASQIQKHVRSHEQKEFCVRKTMQKLGDGIRRIALPAAEDLHIRDFYVRYPGKITSAKLQPFFRRGASGFQRFVRRLMVRDDEKHIWPKLLRRVSGAVQMSEMRRIEAASEDCDSHCFDFTSSIFGSASLRL